MGDEDLRFARETAASAEDATGMLAHQCVKLIDEVTRLRAALTEIGRGDPRSEHVRIARRTLVGP